MHALFAKVAAFVQTKAAVALLGAVVIAGGGTAITLAATHGNLGQIGSGLAAPTHDATETDHEHDGTEGTLTGYTAPSGTTLGSITVKRDDGTTVTFSVNADTRVNGAHANSLADLPGVIGGKVQVQAENQSSGNPLATKITVEDSANSVELEGTVASVNTAGGSFVLTTANGAVTITITANTKFSSDDTGLAGLKAGERVNVQGIKQPDGSVVADHVEIGGDGGPEATHTPHPEGTPEATETGESDSGQ